MTPMITAPIQANLIKDKFNDGYQMYKRLKELLQLSDETEFMWLTQKYYTLNYRNYKKRSDIINYVKSLREWINTTNIEMTLDKQSLFRWTMALWNKSNEKSLVQILGLKKDMTAKTARKMLLENKQRLKAKPEASALVTHSHSHQITKTDSFQYCGESRDKKDSCWRKYRTWSLINTSWKRKKHTPDTPKKSLIS